MQLRNSPDRYGTVAQTFHWLSALFIALSWLLGELHDVFPRGAARAGALFVHNSAGLVVIGLLVLRLLWRAFDATPTLLPTTMGLWGERAARLTHLAIYLLVAAVPVSGIVLQFARGDALSMFDIMEIASPWVRDRAFARSVGEVHEFLSNALLALVLVHAGAALAHHWLWRDLTLARMLPAARR